MSDIDYYKSQPDYEDIKPYLDLTPTETLIDKTYEKFNADFSNAIVVDNIPQVPREKLPKLIAVLIKIYTQIAPITESDIFMPSDDETGITYGFCFVKFTNAEHALNAIKVTQGFALDKKHNFKVSPYSDLDLYGKVSEDDQPPTLQDFNPKPEVATWLTDSLCRDQFSVRHGRETEIYWNNATGEEPTLVYGGEREKQAGTTRCWCDLSVEWSPQGSYFVTFHKQGVKLWGGATFQPCGRFAHMNVEEISFSPDEHYLITYRHNDQLPGDPKEAIIVWDVRTGEKIRGFPKKNPFDLKYQVVATVSEDKAGKKTEKVVRGRVKEYEGDSRNGIFTIEEGSSTYRVSHRNVQAAQDPNRFRWSANSKYVARIGPDVIFVYDIALESKGTELTVTGACQKMAVEFSMELLDKRSLAAKDVLDFAWSPSSNLISYWSPAAGNHPALVNIVRLPDRTDIASRKIVDVTDGKMVWQNDGEYLCVYMTKMQGKKRSYVLMFFRVKDAGVPVEQIEINDPVIQVSWEPSGDRIVVLAGDARSPQVLVYSMSGPGNSTSTNSSTATPIGGGTKGANKSSSTSSNKNELTHLFTKSNIQCNDISWSPSGGVVALLYFAPDACLFDFLDVDNNVIMASRRHDRCSKVYWDPSGRYLATCTILDQKNVSSTTKGQADDGINVYTFQGTLLTTMKREKLFAFNWRTRPKDLLTNEEKKKIAKSFKKYEKMFDQEDKHRKDELNQELQATRFKLAEDFLSWRNRNRTIVAALKPRRIELRSGYDSDDDRNYEIEVVPAEKK